MAMPTFTVDRIPCVLPGASVGRGTAIGTACGRFVFFAFLDGPAATRLCVLDVRANTPPVVLPFRGLLEDSSALDGDRVVALATHGLHEITLTRGTLDRVKRGVTRGHDVLLRIGCAWAVAGRSVLVLDAEFSLSRRLRIAHVEAVHVDGAVMCFFSFRSGRWTRYSTDFEKLDEGSTPLGTRPAVIGNVGYSAELTAWPGSLNPGSRIIEYDVAARRELRLSRPIGSPVHGVIGCTEHLIVVRTLTEIVIVDRATLIELGRTRAAPNFIGSAALLDDQSVVVAPTSHDGIDGVTIVRWR